MDSFISLPGGGNGNPLQYSCLENHMERGAWWVTVHGVVQSRTWLKWLSTLVCHAKGDTSGSCLEELCLNPRGFDEGFFFYYFYFYFILLYNIILVLPYIDMNPPLVYMSSQSWTPLPPAPHIISLDHPCARAPSILYPVSNMDWRFISYMIVYMKGFITDVQRWGLTRLVNEWSLKVKSKC